MGKNINLKGTIYTPVILSARTDQVCEVVPLLAGPEPAFVREPGDEVDVRRYPRGVCLKRTRLDGLINLLQAMLS